LLIYPQKGCEINKERKKVAKKERNLLLLLALVLHLKFFENAYALDTHGSVIYCFPCGNCLSKEHGRLSEDVSNSRIVL